MAEKVSENNVERTIAVYCVISRFNLALKFRLGSSEVSLKREKDWTIKIRVMVELSLKVHSEDDDEIFFYLLKSFPLVS